MKQRQKKSVLFEWAVSYLFVALIPLLMIFVNYCLNMKVIKSEICNINEVALENLSNEIDRIVETQKEIYGWLYSDDAFSNWVVHEGKCAEFYYDASELRKQISNYLRYSGDVDCLVYRKDENYIIGSGFADDARHKYLSLALKYKDYTGYEEWVAQLSADYKNEIVFGEGFSSDTAGTCMVLADSITLKSDVPVNVFISVPLERIENLVENLESSAYLILAYGDDALIINGDEELLTPEIREYMSSGSELFSTKEFIGLTVRSSYKKFSYCLLIEQKEFWEKSTWSRNVFGIGIFATLLTTYAVVWYLLKRNFKPVSSLLKKTGVEWSGENEFYQIELAYNKLKNEKRTIQQILDKQKEILFGSYLLSVMKGQRACLKENEMAFFEWRADASLILCGFNITTEDELLRFAVDNVYAELMETEKFCHMEEGDYLLYLFWVEQEDRFLRKCEDAVAYVSSLFEERWNVKLEFYQTECEKGMEKLPDIYQSFVKKAAPKANMDKISLAEKENGADAVSRAATAEYAPGEIQGVVMEVWEYVAEHYTDSGLNIAAIADAMGKNAKYISRLFKESTGEGILDYLNRIRIDKAKEIIAVRRYTAEEAGALAGYASNQTFRRAFIKLVGMTPGKYAEMLQRTETDGQKD